MSDSFQEHYQEIGKPTESIDIESQEHEDDEGTPLLQPQSVIVQETPQLTMTLIAGYLSQVLGAVLLSVWVLDGRTDKKFLGGVNWFNLHPFFMVWSFGVLFPTGIIAMRFATHEVSKRWYAILHLTAIATTAIAVTGVVVDHNFPAHGRPKPNLYSAHGWIGLALLVVFYAQTAFFIGFYYSKRTIPYRYKWTPYHKQIAAWVMVFSIGVIISGIVRKQSFINCEYTRPLVDENGNNTPDYNPITHYKWLPLGCTISNWSALFLMAGSFITVVGLTK